MKKAPISSATMALMFGLYAIAAAQDAPAPVSVALPAAAPAAVPSCQSVTDNALDRDMEATLAQSKATELAAQSKLYDAAATAWAEAVALCSGRAQDRARSSLQETQKVLNSIKQQLSAGDKCLSYQKNGTDLQDLARKALGEHHWTDAAQLFKKAATNWDLASERCDGDARLNAALHRDQSDIDGFNSENCAPVFEQARTRTQQLRAMDPNTPRDQRQDASQITETLWRSALDKCKGSVLDIVRNNANAIARERGTPWVAKIDPPAEPNTNATGNNTPTHAPVPPAATSNAKASTAVATTVPQPAAPQTAAAAPNMAVAVTAPAAAPAFIPVAATAVPNGINVMVGTALYVGQFVKDASGATYTGNGRIVWMNGDAYEGDLKQGKRQGTGKFTWSDGRKYDGDWVDDRASGKGTITFATGNRYQGELIDGVPEGQGTIHYPSGDTYTGQFKSGNPEGTGTYTWSNGQQFEGDWSSAGHSAHGKLTYQNKDAFEGTLDNGAPVGAGVMHYASGDTYEGQFVQGQPNGQGTFHWKNGDTYSGDWKAGKKDGKGALTWVSGEHWDGQFANDQKMDAPK